MTSEKNEHLSLAFMSQSIDFLLLTEAVFEETLKQGNRHIIGSFLRVENYHEQTKWSDFNVIFPTLFIFYHGIELMMKGLLLLFGRELKHSHKLTELYAELKLINQKDLEFLVLVFSKYIESSNLVDTTLGNWLNKNQLNVNDLYERLRYPVSKNKTKLADNWPLIYQEERGISFIENILNDSKKMRELSVNISRELNSLA